MQHKLCSYEWNGYSKVMVIVTDVFSGVELLRGVRVLCVLVLRVTWLRI